MATHVGPVGAALEASAWAERNSDLTRRGFLATSVVGFAGATLAADSAKPFPLAGEVGVTTGSFTRNLSVESAEGKLRLLDLPRLMREELDMKIIDLMTATLASLEPEYCDKLRAAAERAGCVLTNLKMNNRGLDLASEDAATRRHALDEYKRTMDAAARLGVRWVRPLPGPKRPDMARVTSAYRELIDYGASRGLSLLVENFGWMQDDPDAIPALIKAVGPGLRSQPDTRNWTDRARYEGLTKTFPFAVSCDFKPFPLEPDGSHTRYDLKRCFQIGWDAGFRGPWCLEHFHNDLKQQFKEMALLRDMLRSWMKAAKKP
ncbi:MAG: TIM barrel protein [Verrucomicrobia bacterium]|nr:TIM barrel protein [Verrucomicrobiota bacterium]